MANNRCLRHFIACRIFRNHRRLQSLIALLVYVCCFIGTLLR
ncbi:hypothetical protein JI435_405330 [Parastagonospora nodorum SN15]|uniref:Uncharacterized protein n=1 Tax=Phaeosphaeria nodorum (strain SN15 / ATCC MYA-4574 / FGSC 10173) TaxID=321614 RepID=A0A7U2HZW0_PHANO|nr:hypothetical protein JI435_405330 [Parastagonospora nodorum SN15]